MLTIRFQRVGRKNRVVFRIVLAEKHRSASKKVGEVLGYYNPHTKDFGLKDQDRLKYWIGQNVHISPSVHNLLVTKGILTGAKVQAWKPRPSQVEEAVKKDTTQAVKTPTEEVSSTAPEVSTSTTEPSIPEKPV